MSHSDPLAMYGCEVLHYYEVLQELVTSEWGTDCWRCPFVAALIWGRTRSSYHEQQSWQGTHEARARDGSS